MMTKFRKRSRNNCVALDRTSDLSTSTPTEAVTALVRRGGRSGTLKPFCFHPLWQSSKEES